MKKINIIQTLKDADYTWREIADAVMEAAIGVSITVLENEDAATDKAVFSATSNGTGKTYELTAREVK